MADSSAPSEDASLRPERLWTSLRRIFRYAYPYRYRLALALVLTVFGSVVALVVPLGLRELVDAVFEESNRTLLNRLTLGLILLFGLVRGLLPAGVDRRTGRRRPPHADLPPPSPPESALLCKSPHG
jgi:ABC-type bacteriocin/lantibiotic exporter with double-glycine peptidase domain